MAIDRTSGFIQVDATITEPSDSPPGSIGTVPTTGDFIFFYKSTVAESHGARGYYLSFSLKNEDKGAMELFAVGSDLMQSYP